MLLLVLLTFTDFKKLSKKIVSGSHGIRNKFRWQWLEEKDWNGDYLSDYERKRSKPGLAFCLFFCNHRLDCSKKCICHLTKC